MTNSHEPLAPTGAGDQPGKRVEAQAAGASAGSNGTGDINALNTAQEAAHGAPLSASPQASAERQNARVGDAASTTAGSASNDFASDESADDLDDFDEDA